jgi:hypothetical protein
MIVHICQWNAQIGSVNKEDTIYIRESPQSCEVIAFPARGTMHKTRPMMSTVTAMKAIGPMVRGINLLKIDGTIAQIEFQSVDQEDHTLRKLTYRVVHPDMSISISVE